MPKEDHKRQRVDFFQKFLRRCVDEKGNFLDLIVTGDEIWAFSYTSEIKQQLPEWRHPPSNTFCWYSHVNCVLGVEGVTVNRLFPCWDNKRWKVLCPLKSYRWGFRMLFFVYLKIRDFTFCILLVDLQLRSEVRFWECSVEFPSIDRTLEW